MCDCSYAFPCYSQHFGPSHVPILIQIVEPAGFECYSGFNDIFDFSAGSLFRDGPTPLNCSVTGDPIDVSFFALDSDLEKHFGTTGRHSRRRRRSILHGESTHFRNVFDQKASTESILLHANAGALSKKHINLVIDEYLGAILHEYNGHV